MEAIEIDSRDGIQVELKQGNAALEFEERTEALEQRIARATEEIARHALSAVQGDKGAVKRVQDLKAKSEGWKNELDLMRLAGDEVRRLAVAEAQQRTAVERADAKAEARQFAFLALQEARKAQQAIVAFGEARSALREALKDCNVMMRKAGEPLRGAIGSRPQDAFEMTAYELRRLDTPFLDAKPVDERVRLGLADLLEADHGE
jgi:hypothetical protein